MTSDARRAALGAALALGGMLVGGCVERTPGLQFHVDIEVVPVTAGGPTLEPLDVRLNLATVTLEPCPETVAWTPGNLTRWLVGRAHAHGGAHAEGEDGEIVVELDRTLDLRAPDASTSVAAPIPPHHPICAVWLTPTEPVGAHVRVRASDGDARAWTLFLRPQRLAIDPLAADANHPIARVTVRLDGARWLAAVTDEADEVATRDALGEAFGAALTTVSQRLE